MNTPIESGAEAVMPNLKSFSARWLAWVAFLGLGVCGGLYSYYQQEHYGEIVTGLRTVGSEGAGWGLYIVFVVFFIGVSFAGISVAALIRLFGLTTLKPLARMAELLTICSLLVGALSVLADLGRPIEGLLKLPRLARPTSPFFGTFTMVIGGYLFASLVYFFLACRADAAHLAQKPLLLRPLYRLWASGFSGTNAEFARHHQASFWMSLSIVPLLVTAHSTLGFIFGIQGGRPGWFSPLQAPSFVAMAGASGVGVLIIIAAVLRKTMKLEAVIGPPAFRWLGNLVWILTLVVVYFIIAEELTSSYAAAAHERWFAKAIVSGPYRNLFFLELGSFVLTLAVLFLQFATRTVSIGWTVVGGVTVNVGAVVKRYMLVVPSQTHGTMLPWAEGHYSPSPVELGVVGGLLCLAALMYTMFIKAFPILPVVKHEELAHDATLAALGAPEQRNLTRTLLALGTIVVGLSIAVTGFAISSRVGVKHYADPLVPFSPVIFIIGVMMTFGAAVVYEVFPARKAAPPARAPAPAPLPEAGATGGAA